MGHEFTHATDAEQGIIDRSRNPNGVKRSEEKAVDTENQIYDELKLFDNNIQKRTKYGGVLIH